MGRNAKASTPKKTASKTRKGEALPTKKDKISKDTGGETGSGQSKETNTSAVSKTRKVNSDKDKIGKDKIKGIRTTPKRLKSGGAQNLVVSKKGKVGGIIKSAQISAGKRKVGDDYSKRGQRSNDPGVTQSPPTKRFKRNDKIQTPNEEKKNTQEEKKAGVRTVPIKFFGNDEIDDVKDSPGLENRDCPVYTQEVVRYSIRSDNKSINPDIKPEENSVNKIVKTEIISINLNAEIKRTLKLLTPSFITSDNFEDLMKLSPDMSSSVDEISFGYFFFVTVKDKLEEVMSAFLEHLGDGVICDRYCKECIFCLEDNLDCHKEEDKCPAKTDLNRLAGVVMCDTPIFEEADKVFLVHSTSQVVMEDVEQLVAHDMTLRITFSKTSFIRCLDENKANHLLEILNGGKEHPFGSEVGPLLCSEVASIGNSSSVEGTSDYRDLKEKLTRYPEVTEDDITRTLVLSGLAIKLKEKSRNDRFNHWLQRLFGTSCEKVISDEMLSLDPITLLSINDQGNPLKETGDSPNFVLLLFSNHSDASQAFDRSQMIFLYGHHLNIYKLTSLLEHESGTLEPIKEHSSAETVKESSLDCAPRESEEVNLNEVPSKKLEFSNDSGSIEVGAESEIELQDECKDTNKSIKNLEQNDLIILNHKDVGNTKDTELSSSLTLDLKIDESDEDINENEYLAVVEYIKEDICFKDNKEDTCLELETYDDHSGVDGELNIGKLIDEIKLKNVDLLKELNMNALELKSVGDKLVDLNFHNNELLKEKDELAKKAQDDQLVINELDDRIKVLEESNEKQEEVTFSEVDKQRMNETINNNQRKFTAEKLVMDGKLENLQEMVNEKDSALSKLHDQHSEELTDLKTKMSNLERCFKVEVKEKENLQQKLVDVQSAEIDKEQDVEIVSRMKTKVKSLQIELEKVKNGSTVHKNEFQNCKLKLNMLQKEYDQLEKECTLNKCALDNTTTECNELKENKHKLFGNFEIANNERDETEALIQECKDYKEKYESLEVKHLELLKESEDLTNSSHRIRINGVSNGEQLQVSDKKYEDLVYNYETHKSDLDVEKTQLMSAIKELKQKNEDELKETEIKWKDLYHNQVEQRIKFGKKLGDSQTELKQEREKIIHERKLVETMQLEIQSLKLKLNGEKNVELEKDLYDKLDNMYTDIKQKDKDHDDFVINMSKKHTEEIKRIQASHSEDVIQKELGNLNGMMVKKDEELAIIKEAKFKFEQQNQIIENKIQLQKEELEALLVSKEKEQSNFDTLIAKKDEDMTTAVSKQNEIQTELTLLYKTNEKRDQHQQDVEDNNQLLKEEIKALLTEKENELGNVNALLAKKDEQIETAVSKLNEFEQHELNVDNNNKLLKEEMEALVVKENEFNNLNALMQKKDDEVKTAIAKQNDFQIELVKIKEIKEIIEQEKKHVEENNQLLNEEMEVFVAKEEKLEEEVEQLKGKLQKHLSDYTILDRELKEIKEDFQNKTKIYENKLTETKSLETCKVDLEKKVEMLEQKKDADNVRFNLQTEALDKERMLSQVESEDFIKRSKELEEQYNISREGCKKVNEKNYTLTKKINELNKKLEEKEIFIKDKDNENRNLSTSKSELSNGLKVAITELEHFKELLEYEKDKNKEHHTIVPITSEKTAEKDFLQNKIEALKKENKKLNKTITMLTKDDDSDDEIVESKQPPPLVKALTVKSSSYLLKDGVEPFLNKPSVNNEDDQLLFVDPIHHESEISGLNSQTSQPTQESVKANVETQSQYPLSEARIGSNTSPGCHDSQSSASSSPLQTLLLQPSPILHKSLSKEKAKQGQESVKPPSTVQQKESPPPFVQLKASTPPNIQPKVSSPSQNISINIRPAQQPHWSNNVNQQRPMATTAPNQRIMPPAVRASQERLVKSPQSSVRAVQGNVTKTNHSSVRTNQGYATQVTPSVARAAQSVSGVSSSVGAKASQHIARSSPGYVTQTNQSTVWPAQSVAKTNQGNLVQSQCIVRSSPQGSATQATAPGNISQIPQYENPAQESQDLNLTNWSEIEIETQLFDGLVEALGEAHAQMNSKEIQDKYNNLLENLLRKMPEKRPLVVRALVRAFSTVFPDFACRGETVDEIITPGAASVTHYQGSRNMMIMPQRAMAPVVNQPMRTVQQNPAGMSNQPYRMGRHRMPQSVSSPNYTVVQQNPQNMGMVQRQNLRHQQPQQTMVMQPQQNWGIQNPQQQIVQQPVASAQNMVGQQPQFIGQMIQPPVRPQGAVNYQVTTQQVQSIQYTYDQ